MVEWEVEGMMLNGRFDGGDSGEKTVGSVGKVRTRKRCRRGEVGTVAQKSTWGRGGGKFVSPGGHFSVLGGAVMRKVICKYLIQRVTRGNFLQPVCLGQHLTHFPTWHECRQHLVNQLPTASGGRT